MGIRSLWVGIVIVAAAAAAGAQEAKGGKDSPLISRYEGSRLIAWRNTPFTEIKPLKLLTDDIAKDKKLNRDLAVEGEVQELFYLSPKGRNALEVQRNYEAA